VLSIKIRKEGKRNERAIVQGVHVAMDPVEHPLGDGNQRCRGKPCTAKRGMRPGSMPGQIAAMRTVYAGADVQMDEACTDTETGCVVYLKL
jgi:ribosomal protein L2